MTKKPKLTTYTVGIPVTYIRLYNVKAHSEEEAFEIAADSEEDDEEFGSISPRKDWFIV